MTSPILTWGNDELGNPEALYCGRILVGAIRPAPDGASGHSLFLMTGMMPSSISHSETIDEARTALIKAVQKAMEWER